MMDINNISTKTIGGTGKLVSKKECKKARLKKSCADFDGLMMEMMFKSMRKSLPGDAVFGKDFGSDIYQSMYCQKLSEELSRNGKTLGMGDMLFKELEKKLDQSSNGTKEIGYASEKKP